MYVYACVYSVNHTQFESINSIYSKLYPGKDLKKDINGRIGGDFQQAVLIRCTDKYEYLAKRVDSALTGWSLDNESLCRSVSKPVCTEYTVMNE